MRERSTPHFLSPPGPHPPVVHTDARGCGICPEHSCGHLLLLGPLGTDFAAAKPTARKIISDTAGVWPGFLPSSLALSTVVDHRKPPPVIWKPPRNPLEPFPSISGRMEFYGWRCHCTRAEALPLHKAPRTQARRPFDLTISQGQVFRNESCPEAGGQVPGGEARQRSGVAGEGCSFLPRLGARAGASVGVGRFILSRVWSYIFLTIMLSIYMKGMCAHAKRHIYVPCF